MPNNVFCTISSDNKATIKLLKKISKLDRGLAEYFKPLPKELENTTSPTNIISEKEYIDQELKRKEEAPKRIFAQGITKKMQKELVDKYKFDNWYNWSIYNWGTKWGCYENDFYDDCYTFTTAWSPLDEQLIDELAKLCKEDLLYTFEEETGWGGWRSYSNGVCVEHRNYEEPHWEEEKTYIINKHGVIKEGEPEWNDTAKKQEYEEGFEFLCCVSYLAQDHNNGDLFKKGFYESYSLHERYGDTLKEVFEYHTHNDRVGNKSIIFG